MFRSQLSSLMNPIQYLPIGRNKKMGQSSSLITMVILILTMMIYHSNQATINDNSLAKSQVTYGQSSSIDKRASGFLPMRGRKSESGMDLTDLGDSVPMENAGSAVIDGSTYDDLFNLIQKKNRINSFMPIRDRKWDYYRYPVLIPSQSSARYYGNEFDVDGHNPITFNQFKSFSPQQQLSRL